MKTKKGATSIYVVVIASLLFGVITIGFVHLIVSELKKSTANDLAQSAYDSALAGVEDGKLALSKYYSCINNDIGINIDDPSTFSEPNGDGVITCEEVAWYIYQSVQDPNYCDAVSDILGRNGSDTMTNKNNPDGSGEVLIKEKTTNNETVTQAYTCTKIATVIPDYRSYLSSTDTMRVIPMRPAGRDASEVAYVRIRWYSINDGSDYKYTNYNTSKHSVEYPSLDDTDAATPPTIAVQLYQTAESFQISEFSEASGAATDRGTIWLTPTTESTTNDVTYSGKTFTQLTTIPKESGGKNVFTLSNNHTDQLSNSAYPVKCYNPDDENQELVEYACTVEVALPNPVEGERSNVMGTFLLALSIPYGGPNCEFSVELLDDNRNVINFDNVQVSIDSTGRADDIYTRVESRIEFYDIYFPYPEWALQLGSDDDAKSLSKDFWVSYNCWYTRDQESRCEGDGSTDSVCVCSGGDSRTDND